LGIDRLRPGKRIPSSAAKKSLTGTKTLLKALLRLHIRWQESLRDCLICSVSLSAKLLPNLLSASQCGICSAKPSLTCLLCGHKLVGCCAKIWLCGLTILARLRDTLLLRPRQRSNESFSRCSILLEWLGGDRFSASIDRIIAGKNLWRDRYLLGGCL
jgi:hypothetical protein